jgi:hypothetical protein
MWETSLLKYLAERRHWACLWIQTQSTYGETAGSVGTIWICDTAEGYVMKTHATHVKAQKIYKLIEYFSIEKVFVWSQFLNLSWSSQFLHRHISTFRICFAFTNKAICSLYKSSLIYEPHILSCFQISIIRC